MSDEAELSDVLKDRREKLGRIRDAGIEPFPHEFSDREEIAAVRAEHEGLAPGSETESRHRVAGRIVARRGHGKNAFIDLRDGSGQIQLPSRRSMKATSSGSRAPRWRPGAAEALSHRARAFKRLAEKLLGERA